MRVLGWGLDSLDWKEYGKEELIRRIEGNLETGDIILCRTEPSATAEALGELTGDAGCRGLEAAAAVRTSGIGPGVYRPAGDLASGQIT